SNKIHKARQSTTKAILADRRPAREQRPNRAEVIAARAVLHSAGGDDPHSPVGLMFGCGELSEHRPSLIIIQQSEPHWNGGKHARFVHRLTILIERECKSLFVLRPEG